MLRVHEAMTLLLAVGLLGAGCGNSTCSTGNCAPPDAGAGACTVKGMVVSCTDVSSGGSMTLADSADACAATNGDCQNACAESEFGAACGGLPRQTSDGGMFEPSSAPPSPSCRALSLTPGRVAFYCCPCG